MKSGRALAVALLLFAPVTAALAAPGNASIVGAVIWGDIWFPGSDVSLYDMSNPDVGRKVDVAKIDAEGLFHFDNLPAGTYMVVPLSPQATSMPQWGAGEFRSMPKVVTLLPGSRILLGSNRLTRDVAGIRASINSPDNAKAGRVSITWTPFAGAGSYEVWMMGPDGYTLPFEAPENYLDTIAVSKAPPVAGASYRYWIYAHGPTRGAALPLGESAIHVVTISQDASTLTDEVQPFTPKEDYTPEGLRAMYDFVMARMEKPIVAGKASPGIPMVPVKGGTFVMGDPADDPRYKWATPHTVTVSSFSLGKTPITVAQWAAVMGAQPAGYTATQGKFPAGNISWLQAVEFCNALSVLEGKTPVYTIHLEEKDWGRQDVDWDMSANGYRLPTEAEWEFAARGGTLSKGYTFAGSNTFSKVARPNNIAIYPVGLYAPNELGLFDMTGLIRQFCWDLFQPYGTASLTDPTGAVFGRYGARVDRGAPTDPLADGGGTYKYRPVGTT